MLLSWLAVRAYLPLARRCNWVDAPNHRSSHRAPTPNSGGVALVPVFLALAGAAVFAVYPDTTGPNDSAAWMLLPGVALLAALGAWDDRRHLSARLRLAALLALSSALCMLWLAPATPLAWVLSLLLAVALAWQVNLFNFMDGTDGLAALQCVVVATAMALQAGHGGASPLFQVLALTLAGCYAGFLVLNRPPARLFMGDAGSLSAGWLLGVFGIWAWLEGWLAWEVWALLMSPFLIDTGWTLAARALRGERVWEAHREHAYQRLARSYGGHGPVLRSLLWLHLLWLQPLALLQLLFPGQALTILALGLFPQLLLMVSLRRLE
jgi:Fuc2NAc and GlcNAc transferase